MSARWITFAINAAAAAAHEANRLYCSANLDDTQVHWEAAPENIRESARVGVRLIYDIPETSPRTLHESWCSTKLTDGWVFGEIKDAEQKTHPCLVSYDALPEVQRAKDDLFGATARAMLHALLPEWNKTLGM